MSVGNYRLGEVLGVGEFGVTYLAHDIRNNRVVAVKEIEFYDREKVSEEVATLNELSRPLHDEETDPRGARYIVLYHDSFMENVNGSTTLFIVTEYIDGSTLDKFISHNMHNIRPSFLWSLYLQLLIGLRYIHQQGYAHRDIKGNNILITRDFTIKYIDFGLSCLSKPSNLSKPSESQGPSHIDTCDKRAAHPLYMPPEYFNETDVDSIVGAQARDVWALAVVMFQMAHGSEEFPFQTKDTYGNELDFRERQANIAKAPKYPSHYSRDDGRTNKFLDSLLINDWKKRPTVQSALSNLMYNILARAYFDS